MHCIYKNISYVLCYKTQFSFTFILFDNTFPYIQKSTIRKLKLLFAFESKSLEEKSKLHLNYSSHKLKSYFYLTKIKT